MFNNADVIDNMSNIEYLIQDKNDNDICDIKTKSFDIKVNLLNLANIIIQILNKDKKHTSSDTSFNMLEDENQLHNVLEKLQNIFYEFQPFKDSEYIYCTHINKNQDNIFFTLIFDIHDRIYKSFPETSQYKLFDIIIGDSYILLNPCCIMRKEAFEDVVLDPLQGKNRLKSINVVSKDTIQGPCKDVIDEIVKNINNKLKYALFGCDIDQHISYISHLFYRNLYLKCLTCSIDNIILNDNTITFTISNLEEMNVKNIVLCKKFKNSQSFANIEIKNFTGFNYLESVKFIDYLYKNTDVGILLAKSNIIENNELSNQCTIFLTILESNSNQYWKNFYNYVVKLIGKIVYESRNIKLNLNHTKLQKINDLKYNIFTPIKVKSAGKKYFISLQNLAQQLDYEQQGINFDVIDKYASYLAREYNVISKFGSNEGLDEVNLLFKMHNYVLKNNKEIIYAERNDDFIIDISDSNNIKIMPKVLFQIGNKVTMISLDSNLFQRNTNISLYLVKQYEEGRCKFSCSSSLNYFHPSSGVKFNITSTMFPDILNMNRDLISFPELPLDANPAQNQTVANYSMQKLFHFASMGKTIVHGDISNFNVFNWMIFVQDITAINIIKGENIPPFCSLSLKNTYRFGTFGAKFQWNNVVNTFHDNLNTFVSCCIKNNLMMSDDRGDDFCYNNLMSAVSLSLSPLFTLQAPLMSKYIFSTYVKFSKNTYKNLFFDVNINMGYDLCNSKMYQLCCAVKNNTQGISRYPYLSPANNNLLDIFPLFKRNHIDKTTIYLPADYEAIFGIHFAKKINNTNDYILVDGYFTFSSIHELTNRRYKIFQNSLYIGTDFIPCLQLSFSNFLGPRDTYPFLNTSFNIGICFSFKHSDQRKFMKFIQKCSWFTHRIMDAFNIN